MRGHHDFDVKKQKCVRIYENGSKFLMTVYALYASIIFVATYVFYVEIFKNKVHLSSFRELLNVVLDISCIIHIA